MAAVSPKAQKRFEEFFANEKVPLVLAPLAGVGDSVFRGLCVGYGANLTYTEMVSAKALSYGSAKTQDLLELAPTETCVSVQIFGHEPETMAQQAAALCEAMDERLFAIDMNMGCPVRKIAGKGDGAALMREPELAGRIIRAVVGASSVPVTVKFRRGYEKGNETCVEFARMAQEAGASAVAVHGRFAQQFYTGNAAWDAIARVKAAVEIPVIGNGDVVDGPSAKALLEESDCDALMIGRGAQGSPWVFRQVRAYLEGEEALPEPNAAERMQVAKKHAQLLAKALGPGARLVAMRKHAMWYLHGLQGASVLRRKVNDAVSLDDFLSIFSEAEAMNGFSEARGE